MCACVADTGAGMDAATLARATEPFFTTKGVGKGTGLGLSMVHGLAAQSGGALRLSSRPGARHHGRALAAPRRRAGRASRPRRHATAHGPRRPATVLLVDDDALVSAATASMLEDLGHRVIEAPSGKEALEILRRAARRSTWW